MNTGKIKKFILAISSIILLFVTSNEAFASSLYVVPQSTNIPYGKVVAVNIGLNTYGESVNGVSSYLSYPSDKIEIAWILYGDAFPVQAEESYDGGIIKISRGSFVGEIGNVNIATIGLRGKAFGTAMLSFVDGSYAPRTVNSSDSLDLAQSSGGIFTSGVPGLGLNPLVFL